MFNIHSTTVPAFTVSIVGPDFVFADINADCLRESGLRACDQIGRRPQDCFPSILSDRLLAHYRRCAGANKPITYELEYVLPSGYTCWRTTLVPFVSPETRQVVTLLGFCFDATNEKMAERATQSFHEKLSLAVGAIDGGFWIYDVATGEFETSRPLAELIAGPGHASLSLAEYAGYIHAEDLGARLVVADVDSSIDHRVVSHDGRMRWLRSKRRTMRDANGVVTKIVGLVLEVTEQKTAMRTLETEAATDGLTLLKNRRAFERTAAKRFRETRGTDKRLGLVLIDLDGFKPINDLYGHRAGDEILRKVARRMSAQVGADDTLARIGGDEFALLTGDGSPAALRALTKRMEGVFAKPFRLGDKAVPIGASVGVGSQTEEDRSLSGLFERADRALYVRKHARHPLSA